MVLNYIWVGFILIAFLFAIVTSIVTGNGNIFQEIMSSVFESADTGFKLSIGLTGALTLWLGIMKIGENGGVVQSIAKLFSPILQKIFPDLPKNHPAFGSIVMNFSANMLGLDNAATPLGLKAMEQLQEENPDKERASNAQIMFLVLNTSGLTLIPISIIALRIADNSTAPAEIFIPILIATFVSSLVGLIVTSLYQRINLFQPTLLLFLLGTSLFFSAIIAYFTSLSDSEVTSQSNLIAYLILMIIIVFFVLKATIKKVNVYESFIEGAKDGFNVAIKIIPYLIAILVAIAMFRASGAMEYFLMGLEYTYTSIASIFVETPNTDFIGAMPTAMMKPLSGGGARGMMVEAFGHYGVDSFQGKLASTLQGSTETTFYVLAVYFGSVGIKNTRYAVTCGLLADLAGIIAAIILAYIFF